jgi:hypothetical protein
MALRWFVMQNQGKLAPRMTLEMLDKIPGDKKMLNSRRIQHFFETFRERESTLLKISLYNVSRAS